jgi:1-deoxy-D-xylulose-5-phosphate synthase
MASGLAKEGFKPVVAVYSTFLQRAYDQIIEEIALQNLAVIFAIDRAGVVGEDGATHQGIFDIAFLRNIPNLIIMAPKDGRELEEMLEFAVGLDRPVAIRYPKSVIPLSRYPVIPLELGKAEALKLGKDFAIIALGSMVGPSFEAIDLLKKDGLSGTLINARGGQPQDSNLFKDISAQVKFIFSAEEAILDAGFGSAVQEVIERPIIRMGLPCEFITHGRRDVLLEKYGLTKEGIALRIKELVR